MSQWIWRFGEFEIYHSLMLHNRRQQYGYPEPVVWKMYAPEPVVQFRKTVTTKGGMIRIRACGNFSVTVVRTGDKGSQSPFPAFMWRVRWKVMKPGWPMT
ncbi:hypothetical protein [Blautia marasmi]|uniref:hypothetical protein n=1 Tax=Blautia marasmi TaxID=1917868 RepID=UPI00259588A4|nr:hypothetical protein [uncultured Blautia sp.]